MAAEHNFNPANCGLGLEGIGRVEPSTDDLTPIAQPQRWSQLDAIDYELRWLRVRRPALTCPAAIMLCDIETRKHEAGRAAIAQAEGNQ